MKLTKPPIVVSNHPASVGSTSSYSLGFGLSILLTLITYDLVVSFDKHHITSHLFVFVIIIISAIIQLFVQLILFLHLNHESKPRWNLLVLLFAAMVVVIIVGGSLWIMYNLNYRMTPDQINKYLNGQDGF